MLIIGDTERKRVKFAHTRTHARAQTRTHAEAHAYTITKQG